MRRALLPSIAAGISALALAPPPAAATTGMVVTNFGAQDRAATVVVQADGKIVAAGRSGNSFAVARYNGDGMLDTSFSGDGLLTTTFPVGDGAANAVALEPGGKIVVAGGAGGCTFALARYTTSGALDTSFGDGGLVTAGCGAGTTVGATAVLVQPPDGRIVAAAHGEVARFTADGTLDTSFGTAGIATIEAAANAAVLQPDGKIVVAGNYGAGIEIERLDADGSLDTGFGAGGTVKTGVYDYTSAAAVALGPGGRIVVAGATIPFGSDDWDFALVSLTAGGALDTTFADDGLLATNLSSPNDYATGVLVQPDGRIVASGYSGATFGADFAIARYEANGTLDTSFSGDGLETTDLGGNDHGYALARQGDGRLVVAGDTWWRFDFALARYDTNGALDTGFTGDTTPPDTTIDSGPSGWANPQTQLRYAFSSNDTGAGTSFECRLDDDAWATCTSPQDVYPGADGAHSFDVRAIDGAGNADPTPATRVFTLDTRRPVTTILSGPTGPTNDNTPTFTFVSDEPGSAFECSNGGGPGDWAPCASPFTVTRRPDGGAMFIVQAVDPAGNRSEPAASVTYWVDTVAPDTTITGGPPPVSRFSTPTFEFSASEGPVRYECSLDGGAFGACGASQRFGPLADGTHTLAVRAIDPAGNLDATPAATTFTIDTVAPQATIASGPAGTISATTATFTYSSSEAGARFECALDAQPLVPCGPAFLSGPLPDGPHVFSVHAVDAAGNVGAPASRSFTVDTTAPKASLAGATTQRAGTTLVVVVSKASEPATVTASGTVTVPGASRVFRLPQTASRALRPGGRVTLRLKVPAAARRAIKIALARGRGVHADVTVRIRDAAGLTATRRRAIRLRG